VALLGRKRADGVAGYMMGVRFQVSGVGFQPAAGLKRLPASGGRRPVKSKKKLWKRG